MHDGGSIRTAFCHAIDITPTVLDVTGIELPEEFQGVGQVPLHGDSLAPGWEDAEIRIRSGSQYFEQLGHRGVWKDGWKAVTYHFKGTPFDQDQWRCTTSRKTSRSVMICQASCQRSSRSWYRRGGLRRRNTASCRSTTAPSSS